MSGVILGIDPASSEAGPSRKDALAVGLKRYYGKLCLKHNSAERGVANRACIECQSERRSAWKKVNRESINRTRRAYEKRHPERIKAKNIRYRKQRPEVYMCASAKIRAKRSGLEFACDPSAFLVSASCPCCGVSLVLAAKHSAPNSPTADRIDPLRGYVPDNLWVICRRCNTIKSDATAIELRKIADAIEARLLEAERC